MDYVWSIPSTTVMRADEGPRPRPPTGLHGHLGDWAVVGFGVNICSIVCSAVVILTALYVLATNAKLRSRPSIRISTGISVCDLMYSVCQVFIFNNDYMSSLSEINLRVILWMMSGSTVTFVLLSTCMGIQLLLTVITRNGRLATVVQPWYELGSFVAGFLITHPYMYLFRSVRWIPAAQVFFLEDVISVSRRNLWLIQWMWVFASIVFLFGIAVFTHLKISPVWTKEVNLAPASPEKLDLLDSPTVQNMTATHRRYIRSVTQRVMVYPMIPVFTQSMVVVANLLPRPPFWIFVMANIMPTFQGVLNFIAFALTPALDEYRKPLVKRLLGITRRRDAEFGELADAETLQPPSTVTSLPPSTFSAYKPGSAFIP